MAVVVPFIATWDNKQLMRAQREMQRAGASIKRTGAGISSAGSRLTQGVTVPLALLGGFAFQTSAKFETAMNQVQAATDAPAAEMEKLGTLAKKMGANTVFSANESALAMLELAKAGMSPAAISAGGLEASLRLAAAGGISLESAATTAANAMNMFGLKAKDAGAVANALAGGANASSASVDSLQQALSQVGPGARNAGLTLQDTVGVLAAFADKGIQGSDAGTSLKTMLTRLVPATDKAKNAMKKYGLSFVDSKGRIDSVTTVAQKLHDKLGKLSQAERIRALTTIFGSDATRAATVMMQEGSAGLAKYIKATKNQTAAQEMADARMKGSAGAIEKMKGSLETAALTIGQVLAPMVSKAADMIKRLADAFGSLSPKQQEMIVKIGLVAAAIGPALLIFGNLISSVGTVVQMFGHMAAAAAGSTSAAAGGFAMLGPIALIIGVVAGAVGLLVASFGGVSKFMDAMKSLGTTLVAQFNVLKAKIGELVTALAPAWNAIVAGVTPALAGIKTAFTGLATEIMPTITALVGYIIAVWKFIAPVVLPILKALGSVIANVFGAIMNVIRAVMAVIRGDWKGAWNAIKAAGLQIWNALNAAAKGIFRALGAALSGIWEGIKKAATTAWKALSAAVVKLWNALVKSVKDKISDFLKIGSDIADGIKNGLKNAWDGLVTKLKNLVNLLPQVVKDLLGIRSPSRVFAQLGSHIGRGLAEGIEGSRSMVAAAAAALAGAAMIDAGGTFALAGAGSYGSSGAAGYGSSSRASRITTIAPGAIQIVFQGGTSASLDDVRRVVDDALGRLADALDRG